MIKDKALYLQRLTNQMRFASVPLSEKMDGSSPPSVFIGKFGYPKVSVGPLIPPQHGDTSVMDLPEQWLGTQDPEAVIKFRLQLVRGKETVHVKEGLGTKLMGTVRDIALAQKPVDIEAEFKKKPMGGFVHEELQPFGPSAPLKQMTITPERYEHHVEKAYYDTDLMSTDAVVSLYNSGVFVSSIQKAFSVGAFGLEKNRCLVPTRWSITAVDDTLGKHMLDEIRAYPAIDNYRVYEFGEFNNYFAILLIPSFWQYESMEAFMHIFGREELIFSDWEPFGGKKGYALIGGCYYSAKLAILEKLKEMRRQAGAIVFREVYSDYVPLGVWLVRECSRNAMASAPREFETMEGALGYISSRLRVPFRRYREKSVLLKQSNLMKFLGARKV